MLDWNGNGKTDPIDVGISTVAFEESSKPDKVKKYRPGCIVSVLAFAFVIILFSLILCLS